MIYSIWMSNQVPISHIKYIKMAKQYGIIITDITMYKGYDLLK